METSKGRDFQMLKRFEVKNFKGFNETLVFDLQAREYSFNKHIVKNDIVNKAIIYGKNGIGKSSLGIALFDIISHLTDKERMKPQYLFNYINLNSNETAATFKYFFQFGVDEIVYEYEKTDINNLVSEKLTINGKEVLYYNYFNRDKNFIEKDLVGDLYIDLLDNRLSVVKYIYRNTPTNTVPAITKMLEFCENMLWYRSLSEGNQYCGYSNGVGMLVESLYQSGNVKNFEKFLKENGLDYKLSFVTTNGIHELIATFESGKKALFVSLASTGTMALFLFYYWSISFNKISLLFIDEFDAFFHYESAESVIKRLNSATNFQTIVTTHNTYLMQNKLTRPDCCYIMTDNKVTALCNATQKEIREAHNLEKMYINGAFNE